MPLTQPGWFSDLEAWWIPAVGEDVARHVEPVGIDDSKRLHVRCSSPAWRTQTRLIAAALTGCVNEVLAPRSKVAGIVVQAVSSALPRIIRDRWPDIVGEDLAGQVEPVMLGAQGRELCTVAASADARDEAARRAPEILARIRELIGEQCAITRWSPSALLPVVVLVTGSSSATERQAVEDVLLQTWHDAIEAFGTEHTLILEHGCATPVDRFVSEWVARLQLPDDAGLMSAPMAADTARHYDQAVSVRDQQMVARRPDLCLAFVRRPSEVLPLETQASAADISVQRVLLP
ncbi:DciA family protein [Streptomyces nodosus]|uniref:DciA family protein n=1 Tax=Streptomyces nodosus TaxID=40318 RepID=UPI0036E5C811